MNIKASQRLLLVIDALVNLLLGLALLLAPYGLGDLLGLPDAANAFYSMVLGGVLIGIAAALLLSLRCPDGLGLLGAIVINLCGAGAVGVWLVSADVQLPARGQFLLWGVVILVLGLGFAELFARLRSPAEN